MMAFSYSVKIGQLSLVIILGLVIIPDRIIAETSDRAEASDCDDVAIIGAGIAGTYAAWKLRNTNQKITIYEYSNRIGGRLYTKPFDDAPDIMVDLGGMRFKPASHVRLNRTIHDLGLNVMPFVLGAGPTPDTLMYLRGSHLKYKELGEKKTNLPYNIGRLRKLPLDKLKWKIYSENTNVQANETASFYDIKSSDGVPLYDQSMQEFMSKYVNSETIKYLKAVDNFDVYGDMSTVDNLQYFTLSDPNEEKEVIQMVKGGMERIPKQLLRQFLQQSPKHSFVRNRHLTVLQKKKVDKAHVLTFQKTRTRNGKTKQRNKLESRCAKKVILAINRMSLEQLDWDPLKQPYFTDIITNSVKDAKAAKLFLAYREPWWRQTGVDFQYGISDTLLQQTYDFGTSKGSNVSVLNAGYIDIPLNVAVWEDLQKRNSDKAELSVSNEMMTMVNRVLAEIYKTSIETIPKPLDSAIQIWNYYPFGGAWQRLMPGYDWSKVEYTMTKPSDYEDVYVATNAFSGRSMSYWAEGALEVVDLALQHFNM